MMRSCSAALLVLCALASSAPAQVYTGYYHAPPYDTYAGYAPAGFNGPLRIVDWRWWAGVAPYSPAYAYPGNGTAYTAGYAPTTYTAGYGPSVYTADYHTASYFTPSYATTSYYGPSYDTAIAYYPSPYVSSPDVCCSPCMTGTAYNPNCPGGNCAMNYQPNPAEEPVPDGTSNPPASGTQQYENESQPAPGTGTDPMNGFSEPAPGNDDWRSRYDRPNGTEPAPAESTPSEAAPADGFGGTPGGANYGPQEPIEQKAPQPNLPETEPAPEAEEQAPADDEPAADAEIEIFQDPIIPDPEAAMPLVNRDSRISSAPSIRPERRQMSARFGSPQLARSQVNPKDVPSAKDLKLVRK